MCTSMKELLHMSCSQGGVPAHIMYAWLRTSNMQAFVVLRGAAETVCHNLLAHRTQCSY